MTDIPELGITSEDVAAAFQPSATDQFADRIRAIQEIRAEKEAEMANLGGVSRNELIFSALASALPVALGAAISGKDGALAGMAAGGESQGKALEQVVALGEQDKKDMRSAIDKLKKEELALEKMGQTSEDKRLGRIASAVGRKMGKSDTNINVDVGKLDLNAIEKKIDDEQTIATSANQRAMQILTLLDSTDANGKPIFDDSETFMGAMLRNVKADVFQEGEAQELRRLLKQWAVEVTKESFPGSISDSERKFMLEVKGANYNVPIKTLRSIARNAIASTTEKTNLNYDRRAKTGIPVRLERMVNPLEEYDRRRAGIIERKPVQEDFVVNGVMDWGAYEQALTEYRDR